VGVCSAQSWTTEQLLAQPKTRMARRKSGEPLFGGVWMRLYEDEIRSVEGPDARKGAGLSIPLHPLDQLYVLIVRLVAHVPQVTPERPNTPLEPPGHRSPAERNDGHRVPKFASTRHTISYCFMWHKRLDECVNSICIIALGFSLTYCWIMKTRITLSAIGA